jgi:hypothetical protein
LLIIGLQTKVIKQVPVGHQKIFKIKGIIFLKFVWKIADKEIDMKVV